MLGSVGSRAAALLLVLSLVPSSAAYAAPSRALEDKLLDDAKDGRLDQLDLETAALVASGVADVDVAQQKRALADALAPAIARARTQRTARLRGAELLRALHDTVLLRYVATATDVDDVVHTGEYNCLSSAILFVIAARGLLDDPRAMVSTRHAFARVTVDGKAADVETTSPIGFDVDRAHALDPQTLARIAGSSGALSDKERAELERDLMDPEELPLLSLIAGIYANRAVGLLAAGDRAGAGRAVDVASRLAAGNAKARFASWRASIFNNQAVELLRGGRAADAVRLLELARQGATGPSASTIDKNLGRAHLALAEAAGGRDEWESAGAHLAVARSLGVPKDELGNLEQIVAGKLAVVDKSDTRCQQLGAARERAECFAVLSKGLREQGKLDEAVAAARAALRHDARAELAARAFFFGAVAVAERERKRGKCDDVQALLDDAAPYAARALASQPDAGPEKAAARFSPDELVGSCFAARADRAFQARRWEEAGALYQRAASLLPAEQALRHNLAAVDANRAGELVEAMRCDEARPLLVRAAAVLPEIADKRAALLERCAGLRVKAAADRGDYATALVEARRGVQDNPKSAAMQDTLGAVLHNLAVSALEAKQCDRARALLPDLQRAKRTEAIRAVEQACK